MSTTDASGVAHAPPLPSRRFPTARFAAICAFLVIAASVALLAGCPPSRKAVASPPAAPQAVEPPSVQQSVERSPARTETTTGTPARTISQAAPEHPQPEKPGLLSVIIDDAGYSLSELQAFLDLPVPLTIAVLPNLPHSTEAARRVLAAGKDLILHCPMEPTGGENPGPGALYTGESTARTDPASRRRFRLGSRRAGDEQPHGLQGHG